MPLGEGRKNGSVVEICVLANDEMHNVLNKKVIHALAAVGDKGAVVVDALINVVEVEMEAGDHVLSGGETAARLARKMAGTPFRANDVKGNLALGVRSLSPHGNVGSIPQRRAPLAERFDEHPPAFATRYVENRHQQKHCTLASSGVIPRTPQITALKNKVLKDAVVKAHLAKHAFTARAERRNHDVAIADRDVAARRNAAGNDGERASLLEVQAVAAIDGSPSKIEAKSKTKRANKMRAANAVAQVLLPLSFGEAVENSASSEPSGDVNVADGGEVAKSKKKNDAV